jgi:TP901 family phage tail tape measure protein
MVDKRDIEFQIEGDASDATSAIKKLSAELDKFLHDVEFVEKRMRQLFTGTLPKSLQGLEKSIRTAGALPQAAEFQKLNKLANQMKTGGPGAQFDNALFQGVLNNIRTDKALQALKMETELNKVLGARETLFKRIRAAMPDAADTASVAKGYREALKAVGDVPPTATAERRKWMQRTFQESKEFEAKLSEAKMANLRKEAEADNDAFNKMMQQRQATYDRYMRRSFSGLFALTDVADRDAQATGIVDRLRNQGARTGFNVDTARLQAMYEEEARARAATAVAMPPKPPKPAGPTHQERIAQSIQNTHDRFDYQGGAGMFGIQGRILANYAVMGSVLTALTFAGSSTVKFQAQLKDVQAISASTDLQMKALQKTIMDVGNTTKFSVSEIADATKILAQAGYSISQIQQVIQPITQLAAGAGATLEDAANITTSVLSVFDMSLGRTAQVTNTLTAGLNESKLSLDQMSLGIQYAGNISAEGGVQFEELVSALGAMANAGIKSGSTLGTGFRAMIVALENPTKKFREQLESVQLTEQDVDIRSRGLTNVLQTMKEAGFGSSQAFGSMEVRAAAAYTALTNNLNVFEDMQEKIVGTTAAVDASNIQMDTFNAQLTRLGNAVTSVSSSVGGPFLSMLQGLVGGLASLLNAANSVAPAIQLLGTLLLSFAAASLILWLKNLAAGLLANAGFANVFAGAMVASGAATGAMTLSVGALITSLRTLTVAFLATPIGWLTAGIALLTAGYVLFGDAAGRARREMEKSAQASDEASAKAADYGTRIREIDKHIEMLTARHESLTQKTAESGAAARQAAESAVAKFGEWGLSIDKTITNTDVLIQRMIKLRQETAAAMLVQAQLENRELNTQREKLAPLDDDPQTLLATRARNILSRGGTGLSEQTIKQLQFASGLNSQSEVSSQFWVRLQANLDRDQGRMRDEAKRRGPAADASAIQVIQQISGLLTPVTSLVNTAVQRDQIDNKLRSNDRVVAGAGITSTSQSSQFTTMAQAIYQDLLERSRKDAEIKDPSDRLGAQGATEIFARGQLERLEASVVQFAAAIEKDPTINAALREESRRTGTPIAELIKRELLKQTPAVAKVRVIGGVVGPSDTPEAIQARLEMVEARANLALKQNNNAEFERLRGEGNQLRRDLVSAKAIRAGDNDFGELAGINYEEAGAYDKDTERRMLGGSGRSGGGSNAKTKREIESEIKDLERQIEIAQMNLGEAGIPTLKELLAKWKDASERKIRLDGGDAEGRIEDFQSQAKEYADKVIFGTMQDAADFLAKKSEEDATTNAASISTGLNKSGGSLEDAIKGIQEGFDKALDASIKAADLTISSKGGNAEIAPAAIEARRQKTIEFAKKSIEAIMNAVDQFLEGEARRNQEAFDQLQQDLERRRTRINMLSNAYGMRNLSDVQRSLGAKASEGIAAEQSKGELDKAQRDYDLAQIGVAQAKSQLDSNTDPDVRNTLEQRLLAASEAAKQAENNLNGAKNAYESMTGKAESFKTAGEAASAAWQVFLEESKAGQPIFEQMADGLKGVFTTVQNSLQETVRGVLDGTMSIGDAFKNLATSILDSLLDLASKMIANQILTWALQLIASSFGGGAAPGAPGATTSGFNMNMAYQGGEIKRKGFSGGGYVTGPLARDSVPALLAPGEVVMSRSAVEIAGKENLLAMNARGNRRMSRMPSISGMMPQREPDTVNVWVVSPEQKPSMTSKDIVAAITNDMATNGQTKQLIKAIQVGRM